MTNRWLLGWVVLTIVSSVSAQEAGWEEGFAHRGVSGHVYTSADYDDGTGSTLYIGGAFYRASGAVSQEIARWNGQDFEPIASDVQNGAAIVFEILAWDDGQGSSLFIGGCFESIDGVPVFALARYDGSGFSGFQAGFSAGSEIYALAVHDDGSGPALYVGGKFQTPSGLKHLARWDGTSWSTVGGPFGGPVEDLVVWNDGAQDLLVAGGRFTDIGGVAANRIAVWDGSTWSSLGAGMDNWVEAMAVYDHGNGAELIAGGRFLAADGQLARAVARWDGSAWHALGSGLDIFCDALAVYDEGAGPVLMVGGVFTSAGGVSTRSLARWDGTAWSAVGTAGVEGGDVRHLAVHDLGSGDRLIIGGAISGADGVGMSGIGNWDGTSFHSMGSGQGMDGSVRAMAMYDSGNGEEIHVGGTFLAAGGELANGVARWDGASWRRLGNGVDLRVEAMTPFDDGSGEKLVVGGYFNEAGGVPASSVAAWDGSAWSALGAGIGPPTTTVDALFVFDEGAGDRLFAGGSFQTAGGQPATNCARWDGTSWSAVGGGFDNRVQSFEAFDLGSGPRLLAGGSFQLAGGQTIRYLASWDGLSWSPLGSPDGTVTVLEVLDDGSGPALYVGGSFGTIGGINAKGVARFDGTNWSAFGNGLSAAPLAFELHPTPIGTKLIAGGSFDNAGRSRVVRFHENNWGALPGSTDAVFNYVEVLKSYVDPVSGGRRLFVGGHFHEADGVVSSSVGRWINPHEFDVTSIEPNKGPFPGGNVIVIRGVGFRDPMSVDFEGRLSPSVTVLSDTELHVVVPPYGNHSGPPTGGLSPVRARFNEAMVDVVVSDGNDFELLVWAYTYHAKL